MDVQFRAVRMFLMAYLIILSFASPVPEVFDIDTVLANLTMDSAQAYEVPCPLMPMPGVRRFSPEEEKRVSQAYCDAITLAIHGWLAAQHSYKVLPNYFDPEKRVIVKNVFRYMVGTNSEDSVKDPAGSERIVGRSQILRGPTEKERFCDAPLGNMPIAGIVQGESDGREGAFIMFCPPTTVLELRNLEEIRCEDLGDTVSGRMNVLGGVLLHEYVHWDWAMYRPGDHHIGDYKDIRDDAPLRSGYGPINVRELLKYADTTYNADNYRWLAQQAYWENKCGRKFAAPRSLELDGDCISLPNNPDCKAGREPKFDYDE